MRERTDAEWIIRLIQPHVDEYKKLAAEYNALAAENERLRKAGDAMAHWIDYQHDKDGYPFSEAWEAANKVKKGKSV